MLRRILELALISKPELLTENSGSHAKKGKSHFHGDSFLGHYFYLFLPIFFIF